MANHKSPLRDRLLSNSPDVIKSSILRESGMGWNSPPRNFGSMSSGSSGSITSPLRIAKRDSPSRALPQPQVARRSSSSYKHVKNNNLVSKSPFKSQIPTPTSTPSRPSSVAFPSPRRVSGEKRPRPSSMHEQGENENDRPFALKRERRQSKTFQGLLQKEPVTKSPFKQRVPSIEGITPPLPPAPIHLDSRLSISSSFPAPTPPAYTNPSPPAPAIAPPPVRSCLVSRRMHGPRLSGGGGGNKRGQRKKVIFDQRCDVIEFDREETDEEVFDDDEYGDDVYGLDPERHHSDEDPFLTGREEGQSNPMHADENTSYESIAPPDIDVDANNGPVLLEMALDPDTSISGLVEEMLFSSNAANVPTPDSILSMKPGHLISNDEDAESPHRHVIADNLAELETDDVFGALPHSDRFFRYHHRPQLPSPPAHASPRHWTPPHHSSPHPQYLPESPALASPQGTPVTPPRRKRVPGTNELSADTENKGPGPGASPEHRSSPRIDVTSEYSATPPFGHPTPLDRARGARHENYHDDMGMLSETPPRSMDLVVSVEKVEVLVPEDEDGSIVVQGEDSLIDDTFNISITKDGPPLGEAENDLTERSNLSMGCSDSNFSSFNFDEDNEMKKIEDTSYTSIHGIHSPFASEKVDTVTTRDENTRLRTPETETRLGASLELSSSSSPSGLGNDNDRESGNDETGRHRINREEITRRLMTRKSIGSPNSSDLTSAGPADMSEGGDEPGDKEKDRLSVLTTMTDISAEMATIETAEKRILTSAILEEGKELGVLGVGHTLQFDFGSKFGLSGFRIGNAAHDTRYLSEGMPTASHERETETGSVKSGESMKMGTDEIDVDMDMRSALDRLMEDVAGKRVGDSKATEEHDSYLQQQYHPSAFTPPHSDAVPDSALLHDSFASRNASGSSSVTVAPPVPPKDNIRNREQMIIEKRREARRLEEGEGMDHVPQKVGGRGRKGQELLGVGRPSRRRSMSTGDAEALQGAAKERGDVLWDLAIGQAEAKDDLVDTIERELKKRDGETHKSQKYLIREREGTIYASSSDPDCVSHMAGPGDVNAGRAWRPVRRPSDMNEYSKQIKEYRAQEKPGKAYGKVFVKVMGVRGIHVPLPSQSTALTCTLNNGIHFVSTPECQFGRDTHIEQEFELIEHSKLEFTLTLKVRRDPHIIAQFKALTPALPPAPPPVVPTSSKGGMRSFFSSSPKKPAKEKTVVQTPPLTYQLPENLARYLKADGTLARAFISFKDVAPRCDVKLFETSYPLIGQRAEVGGKFSTLQVGEIMLQMFRLPPFPGIAPAKLPQSLEECHRGLRHINWHKVTYFEGTLTQFGGDCSTWRRRQLRVIGANLVAFNDVTKKPTATIDLKKAIAVEDDQEARQNIALGQSTRTSRFVDEYDGIYGMERSFRLVFPQNQEIVFFADTDEEKARWLDVLRALVGHIPPHPLWAELLWQRQDELTKKAQISPSSSQPNTPAVSPHARIKNQHR